MKIVALIPTMMTKPKLLEKCLQSLVSLKIPENVEFKILLMINQSHSKLPAQVERQQAKINRHVTFKVIWIGKNVGFAKAMNLGAKAALKEDSGIDYVLSINDDVMVDTRFLEEVVNTIRSTGAEMIATTVFRYPEKKLDSQGFLYLMRGKAVPIRDRQYFGGKLAAGSESESDALTQKVPFGPDAGAAAYSIELFSELGGFNESFFAYLEDVEIAYRARSLGMGCALADGAVAYHYKHATSSTWPTFKSRQDMINWWRIVLRCYTISDWNRYGALILLERARNVSGYVKAVFSEIFFSKI